MDAVVKEEEVSDMINMIEPKKEVIDESWELIEPKVELIDEMDVKKEEIDEDQYQHIIPYEYRDTEKETVDTFIKPKVECQLCQRMLILQTTTKAQIHAAVHLNLARFSCPVEGCGNKNWHLINVIRHMQCIHKFVNPTGKDVVRMDLSHKEKEELNMKIEECFPGVAKPVPKPVPLSGRHVHSCHICQALITEQTIVSTFGRENHASTHTDIMLYKCIKPDCDFKTKYGSISTHMKFQHGIIPKLTSMWKIELTIEQKLERERMVIQCFPELKDSLKRRIKLKKKEEKADGNIEELLKNMVDTCFSSIVETAIIDKKDDIQLSGKKRKAAEEIFETKKKKA